MSLNALTPWFPLIEAVLKATFVLAAAGCVAIAMRRASAASRHMVWTLALYGALAIPLFSLALPRWTVPVVTIADASVEAPAVRDVTRQAPPLRTHALERDVDAANPAPAGTASAASRIPNISWTQALLAVWLLGVVAILGRLAIGLAAVRWMSTRTERVIDAPWLPMACELAREIGVSNIRFLRSRRATMPMAWGVFRASVVMPADADEWPADRLRLVLLHELAHVKRRDCLTHVVAQIACAVYWFNPLAWIAARNIRTERERACDDLVLATGTRGSDYADQLLQIARVMRGGRLPAVMASASLAMAHQTQLEGRLIAILDPNVPRKGLSRVRTASATAACMLAVMPLAAMQPWADAETIENPLIVESQSPTPTPTPKPTPMPTPTPTPTTPRQGSAMKEIERGAIEQVVQGAVQGAVQGTIQGALQGTIEGIAEGVAEAVEQAAEAKSTADPRTIAALKEALKDTDREVRETALNALVQLRDPSIFEPLVAALKDASASVREQAAFGLGQLRDRRAIAPLSAAVKDENPSVRDQAVFALGQMRDPAVIDALLPALRDNNPSVREQAAFAIGQIRDKRTVEPLVSLLKDSSGDVREQAAFALGQIRDRAAVEPLVIALKDDDADVREQAAFALGQLRDPRAIDGLTAALKDANASVRQQAAFALGQLAR